MGQMAAQVVGLSLFLPLVFCAAVTAVGERSQGPKAEFYEPFIDFIYVQYQQVSSVLGSNEIKLNYYILSQKVTQSPGSKIIANFLFIKHILINSNFKTELLDYPFGQNTI